MSAYVHDRTHILAIVRTALEGPSDPRDIRPDNVWYEPRWSAVTDAALAETTWQEAGRTFRQLGWQNAEDVAAMLYGENVASVRYRYADADEAGMVPDVPTFTMTDMRRAPRLAATDALCALASLEYQSCEHPEWGQSEALRFCEAFRRALCNFLSRDSKCWSIHDPETAGR
jgi:hypothetical protein